MSALSRHALSPHPGSRRRLRASTQTSLSAMSSIRQNLSDAFPSSSLLTAWWCRLPMPIALLSSFRLQSAMAATALSLQVTGSLLASAHVAEARIANLGRSDRYADRSRRAPVISRNGDLYQPVALARWLALPRLDRGRRTNDRAEDRRQRRRRDGIE